MNKQIDEAKIEQAVQRTFRFLSKVEMFFMIWALLPLSPWRMRWIYRYMRSTNKMSWALFKQAVNWSLWYRAIHPELSVEQSVGHYLSNQHGSAKENPNRASQKITGW